MDERQLRGLHRVVQPVLQRTAPVESQSTLPLTPAVLDQIAWNVVLAYVANVADQAPPGLPRQAKSGEGALRGEEVRAAVEHLQRGTARLAPKPQTVDRFLAAARRLLGAYGWAPKRAEQAAQELARSLQSAS
ncbi:MAG TPA: hypothetical protein PLJ35_09715 [Anaerolineae bacterium]|nr:hypothetical protein [Anaerolineae bacterium]HOQ99086.1 hypothetical protein [Anaerolineae bacterium]HPL28385.1 hypothetical protein [Anaerolineae bacterium]HPL28390.1 hypothetical protein [Anaerolineae bacterium]